MKEEIKNRVIERLDFTRDITDRRLKEIIQEVILEISREKPMLLEEKIKLSREVFYALRKLDFLQDLLEDEAVTAVMSIYLLREEAGCTAIRRSFPVRKNFTRLFSRLLPVQTAW